MTGRLSWLADPTVKLTGLYLVTLFGAVAMYVFALHKGFEGATAFLRKMFPGRPDVFYDRSDFMLVTLAGSIIGWIVFAPNSAFQALAAGFGWVRSTFSYHKAISMLKIVRPQNCSK